METHKIEKEIGKNIGFLYRVKHLLKKESLKTVNLAYIHSYLNYVNIAVQLTTITHLQKDPVFDKDILSHSRPLL